MQINVQTSIFSATFSRNIGYLHVNNLCMLVFICKWEMFCGILFCTICALIYQACLQLILSGDFSFSLKDSVHDL